MPSLYRTSSAPRWLPSSFQYQKLKVLTLHFVDRCPPFRPVVSSPPGTIKGAQDHDHLPRNHSRHLPSFLLAPEHLSTSTTTAQLFLHVTGPSLPLRPKFFNLSAQSIRIPGVPSSVCLFRGELRGPTASTSHAPPFSTAASPPWTGTVPSPWVYRPGSPFIHWKIILFRVNLECLHRSPSTFCELWSSPLFWKLIMSSPWNLKNL
jgi:hypothetical protein